MNADGVENEFEEVNSAELRAAEPPAEAAEPPAPPAAEPEEPPVAEPPVAAPAPPAPAAKDGQKGKRSEAQQQMQKRRNEKLEELKGIYAREFANLPEKERPKAKAYYAVAILAAKDQEAKLREILAKERKDYEDKKAGIKKPQQPRKTRKLTENAGSTPGVALEPTVPAAAPAAPVKTKKVRRGPLKAEELRAAAENSKKDLLAAAAEMKTTLLANATASAERTAALRFANEAAARVRQVAAQAKASAERLEAEARQAVAETIEELEAGANANLRGVYGAKPVPKGLARGLAELRKSGKTMTAKNFMNVCRKCRTRRGPKVR